MGLQLRRSLAERMRILMLPQSMHKRILPNIEFRRSVLPLSTLPSSSTMTAHAVDHSHLFIISPMKYSGLTITQPLEYNINSVKHISIQFRYNDQISILSMHGFSSRFRAEPFISCRAEVPGRYC